MFLLEKLLWHVECSFGNPAQEVSAENEAESIKIQKGQIKFAHFSQKKRENVAWTGKNIFNNCDKLFRQEFRRFFIQKSRNGRTILILCRKEFSSNRCSWYVECRIDKTDETVSFECSQSHRLKSVNEKNLVSVKKRTLFLQNVSADTWIAIFSELAKNCRKTFKQDLFEIRIWEKINIFKKAVFSRNHAPLDNLNAVLTILPKRFYQIYGRNFCINREKTWFFEKKCFFCKKLPLKTLENI